MCLRMLSSKSVDHLRRVCMDYYTHLAFSSQLAAELAMGSGRALVHAVFPEWYVTSTTDLINDLSRKISQSGCDKGEQKKRIQSER